jgi:hypothetical protein
MADIMEDLDDYLSTLKEIVMEVIKPWEFGIWKNC